MECVYIMHGEFSGRFPDYTVFICKFKTDWVLYIHETFLVYKLETFKNCKEVKHIMIMIIAIIYFFLSYVIFDQQFKITFWKSSGPSLKKSTSPFLLTPLPLKIQKVQVPPFCQHWIFFRPPLQKGGGRTLCPSCVKNKFCKHPTKDDELAFKKYV